MTTHTTESHHISGLAFKTTIDSHTIISDSAGYEGGNQGPSPKKLMLAGLAGCTGIDIADILNKMRVTYQDLKINITGTLTETDPKTYSHVKMVYSIRMAKEDQPKMVKAVNLSMEKYCGVSAMFRAFADLQHEIIYSELPVS